MSTKKVELVETHNLSLSLRRLYDSAPHDQSKWRRALYHALGMVGCADRTEMERIRTTLGLP